MNQSVDSDAIFIEARHFAGFRDQDETPEIDACINWLIDAGWSNPQAIADRVRKMTGLDITS